MTTKRDAQGRLHCDDGPAVEIADGSFVWYRHGVIHRDDGPAVRIVFDNGRTEEEYWINGQQIA